jgi:hypothetical protein
VKKYFFSMWAQLDLSPAGLPDEGAGDGDVLLDAGLLSPAAGAGVGDEEGASLLDDPLALALPSLDPSPDDVAVAAALSPSAAPGLAAAGFLKSVTYQPEPFN